jgi:hypothetical protein
LFDGSDPGLLTSVKRNSIDGKSTSVYEFLVLEMMVGLTRLGFSYRQGEHQEAQKSIKTILPRREESEIFSPVGESYTSSGARSPMLIPVLIPFCSTAAASVKVPFSPLEPQDIRKKDAKKRYNTVFIVQV